MDKNPQQMPSFASSEVGLDIENTPPSVDMNVRLRPGSDAEDFDLEEKPAVKKPKTDKEISKEKEQKDQRADSKEDEAKLCSICFNRWAKYAHLFLCPSSLTLLLL